MRRFLRSTRGRLVLFQVVILAIASAVTAFAIFEYQTVPRRADADNVVYEQWSTIASGLALQDGNIVYTPGRLPESGGDQQVPLETELFTRAGLIGQTSNHVMDASYLRELARHVLETGGSGTIQDATDRFGSPRRLFAAVQAVGDPPDQVMVAVIVSRSTAELESYVRALGLTLALTGSTVIVVGAGLAWILVGRTLRPVRALASAARTISEQDLHRRVEVPAPDDELGELKATFNQMLARLEHSFDSLRRFTADASHELRSPLTLIRTEVDVALAGAPDRQDYERVLRGVQSEVEHLSRMVDQLLLLAQADAGNLAPLLSEIDVADFIEEEAARWAPLAHARGISLDVKAPESGTVSADPDLLRRVMDNLLDNAIRHSAVRKPVDLSARRQDGTWLLEVADQGRGVPEDLRPRIFERFSRADTVRTRRDGGAGLGLALSAAIAEAHGGSLELVPHEGSGAVFQLKLPASSSPALYPD